MVAVKLSPWADDVYLFQNFTDKALFLLPVYLHETGCPEFSFHHIFFQPVALSNL